MVYTISESEVKLGTSGDLADLRGKYYLVYSYPENFLSKDIMRMMNSTTYRQRVGAIMVDEVHML